MSGQTLAEQAAKAGIHPTHEVEEYWDAPDPHNPAWICRICREMTCSMCELEDDDELRDPCLGYSHWDSRQVEGDDGITRTVRKSGTGWV